MPTALQIKRRASSRDLPGLSCRTSRLEELPRATLSSPSEDDELVVPEAGKEHGKHIFFFAESSSSPDGELASSAQKEPVSATQRLAMSNLRTFGAISLPARSFFASGNKVRRIAALQL